MTDVSILIVNYNTAELVCKAIDSCLKQKGLSVEIIVIDNKSQDNSIALLQQYDGKIHLIINTENSGFGKANNLAFQQSHGDYIFLLNPDAQFSTENDLANLLLYMQKNPSIGLAGTRIINDQGHETLPRLTYPGSKHYPHLFKNLPGNIAWVLGAIMMIPRPIWNKVGGFDPSYFLYGEDVDLCLRIRKLGYTIGYNNDISILHVGGASEKSSTSFAKWTRKQDGFQIFVKKHFPEKICRTIIRRDYWRNLLRFYCLKCSSFFTEMNEIKSAKLERYRAIMESAKAFLRTIRVQESKKL